MSPGARQFEHHPGEARAAVPYMGSFRLSDWSLHGTIAHVIRGQPLDGSAGRRPLAGVCESLPRCRRRPVRVGTGVDNEAAVKRRIASAQDAGKLIVRSDSRRKHVLRRLQLWRGVHGATAPSCAGMFGRLERGQRPDRYGSRSVGELLCQSCCRISPSSDVRSRSVSVSSAMSLVVVAIISF